jgi:hypothetical protein
MSREVLNMKERVIVNVDEACKEIREDGDFEVIKNIVPAMFLVRKNVEKIKDSIAIKLREDFVYLKENGTIEQIDRYEEKVDKVDILFKSTLKNKLVKAFENNPIMAKKAEVENKINNIGKDVV